MLARQKFFATTRKLGESLALGQAGKWALVASVIGLLTGFVAVAFEWVLHTVEHLLLPRLAGLQGEGLETLGNAWIWILLIPALGGVAAGWVTQQFAPEANGHGMDEVIRSFHRAGGRVRARVIWVKALASAFTIGSGGSAGREGPIAQMSSGIGSLMATGLKMSDRDRRIFVLAGASAGVGAMFTAPLGGALLMAEVPYRKVEFEGEPIVPCILASIVSYTTFTTLTGRERALELSPDILDRLAFSHPRELLPYLILGIVCAAAGWLHTHLFYAVHNLCAKLRERASLPVLAGVGGLCLGAISLGVTAFAGAGSSGVLYGGYGLIDAAVSGSLPLMALFLLIIAKMGATTASVASGGSGGVFAPSLAIGALIGGWIGQGFAELFPAWELDPAAFALVGMGGFFAGIAKVPITSVIMVSEMTGNYQLLAPLMFVSVVHILLSNGWTAYREQVPGLVDSPAHAGEYVVDVLSNMRVSDVVNVDQKPVLISENATLRQALAIVSSADQSYFPVIDGEAKLTGIFSLTDVRRIFREDVIEDFVIVRDFMVERVATVRLDETLDEALRGMTENGINSLPVVDADDERLVLTLLDRHSVGKAYAQRLRELKQAD